MKRSYLVKVLGAAAASILVLPLLATHSTAAAARLEVTASPIQTWTIVDGLPALPVPNVNLSDCGDLADYDEVVYGTGGPDTLTARNGKQILVGLGGDDILRAGNHDDCLLGGDGSDQLFGDNGRDILLGGSGVDKLDGGSGRDRLNAGGDDGDDCISEGAPDELIGCGLEDVTAGAGELTRPGPVGTEPAANAAQVKGGDSSSPAGPGGAADPLPPPASAENDEPVSEPAPAKDVENAADAVAVAVAVAAAAAAAADADPPEATAGE